MANRLTSKLFVSRLSSYTSREGLWQMFLPFGEVTDAKIVVDHETQRPRGFGFVTYKSEAEAQKAIKLMDGRMVNGRLLVVQVRCTRLKGISSLGSHYVAGFLFIFASSEFSRLFAYFDLL